MEKCPKFSMQKRLPIDIHRLLFNIYKDQTGGTVVY